MKRETSPKLSREEIIYLWKTEGGNYSWAKWAAMHGVPASNPTFMENLLQSVAERKITSPCK